MIGRLIKDDSFVDDTLVLHIDQTFLMVDEIDEFEAVVLAQKPAAHDWEPVTDYSFEARKAIEGKHPQLIKDTFKPKRVLDVGAGFGHLVRLLDEIGVKAWGLDSNPARERDNPYVCTEDIVGPDFDRYIYGGNDLVICREVLEHLTLVQARVAITNLCALSSRYVYITTRFSSEHDILRVETSDDLDPTHITLPAKDLYRLLLTLEGFKRRADLEDAMDHQKKGRCLVYERA